MNRPSSSRRDFLTGRAAADAIINAADQISSGSEGAALPELGASHYLVSLARRAMACQFEFLLNAGQYENGSDAALAALDLVDQLEDQLTVYRDTSEISRLNATAAVGPVHLEPRLFALLKRAVELNAATERAFDITAGPLSRAWGFTRRAGAIPTTAEIQEALSHVGSQRLMLDDEAQAVGFASAGVEINLGAIGKGYALDRCAELLDGAGVGDYLLHGGNSSVLACGTKGGESSPGWSIGLRHPLRPEKRLGEIRLLDRALATSGSGTQYFIFEGKRYGHLLDPRTGWPAEGVLTATAIAPTAAEADALSTAFYILGPAGTNRYCIAHRDVAAVLVTPGQRVGSFEIHTFGEIGDAWTASESD